MPLKLPLTARLLIFFLLLPSALIGQGAVVQERGVKGPELIGTARETGRTTDKERHYTLELLDSEQGRYALRWMAEKRRAERRRADRQEGRSMETLPPAPRRQPYQIGDLEEFYVRNPVQSSDQSPVFDRKEFELKRTGEGVELWVESAELGPGRITETILDEIMDGLIRETPPFSIDPGLGVIGIGKEIFGDPPDVDGSGIIRILITEIEDGYNPPEQPVFIAGFFDPVNLVSPDVIPESNFADILYISSTPGIYREGNPFHHNRLNTVIHEFQHLIQANYAIQHMEAGEGGGISLFQNEGQSELAEILAGFEARAMNFLDSGREVSGNVEGAERWIYRFRQEEGGETVLYDYQRAQLLHSYLAERVGPLQAGSLTRSSRFNDAAYEEILSESGIPLSDFFTGFWLSAYGNNLVEGGPYGFSRPQFAGLQVSNPGRIYHAASQPWVRDHQEEIGFGGALYTQWFGVEELRLEILQGGGIHHHLLWRLPGESGYQEQTAGEGIWQLSGGPYEEIVLVSVNGTPNGERSTPEEVRTFTYHADWTPSGLVARQLSYHGEAGVQSPLPWDSLFSYAVRISPEFDGAVRNVSFTLNHHTNAVQGEGVAELVLREAVPTLDGTGWIPGEPIAAQPFTTHDVASGVNFIGVNSSEWLVEAGREYFISIELVEDRGGFYMEFLFDRGTPEPVPDDPRYYPPRTLFGERRDGVVRWGSLFFVDESETPPRERYNLNMLLSASVVGSPELEVPDFPDPPVSELFVLLPNYPNPSYGETVIEFSVPRPSELNITLHDLLGRQVREIFNGPATTGLHRLRVDASGLASGIYIFRMISPDGVQSRKMTLIR